MKKDFPGAEILCHSSTRTTNWKMGKEHGVVLVKDTAEWKQKKKASKKKESKGAVTGGGSQKPEVKKRTSKQKDGQPQPRPSRHHEKKKKHRKDKSQQPERQPAQQKAQEPQDQPMPEAQRQPQPQRSRRCDRKPENKDSMKRILAALRSDEENEKKSNGPEVVPMTSFDMTRGSKEYKHDAPLQQPQVMADSEEPNKDKRGEKRGTSAKTNVGKRPDAPETPAAAEPVAAQPLVPSQPAAPDAQPAVTLPSPAPQTAEPEMTTPTADGAVQPGPGSAPAKRTAQVLESPQPVAVPTPAAAPLPVDDQMTDLVATTPETPKPQTDVQMDGTQRPVPQLTAATAETPKRSNRSTEVVDPQPMAATQPISKEAVVTLSSLKLNVDEVLRLGAMMDRYGSSQQRRASFDWIARNRTKLDKNRHLTSAHLAQAVGDVQCDKMLAVSALRELLRAGTLTVEECSSLIQMIDQLRPPITVGQLAYIVHQTGAYYRTA